MELPGEHAAVRITQISKSELDEFILKKNAVSLDAKSHRDIQTENQLNSLLEELKNKAETFYVLEWDGTRIPRGAEIDKKKISWTQNGVVSSSRGDVIGYYDRVIDSGGTDGKHQMMVIYTTPNSNPDKPEA